MLRARLTPPPALSSSVSSNSQDRFRRRVRSAREAFESLKLLQERSSSAAGGESAGTAAAASSSPALSARETLLRGNATLEGSTGRLENASRTAREAESTGADILRVLAEQREQMLRMKGGVREVDEQLSASEQILKRMSSWRRSLGL